jgi:glycerol-3-phosphate dehydrogenase
LQQESVDVFIIGGGINGCGIARDAAGRGYSVMLVEQDDLASGTSSASTKLVHGGLRYLEQFEFRLVREALAEREILLSIAPHVIWPLRLILPHHSDMRSAWFIRLGLLIYDYIGGRRVLAPTKVLDLRNDKAGNSLKARFTKAFEFSDCWVNDARLVVLNACDAAERGARIATRTKAIRAAREQGEWLITTEHTESGHRENIRARLLVNATGPWVDQVLKSTFGHNNEHNVRLVKGSHIVVGKKYEHGNAYFFQNPDGRIFFAIPFEKDYTLIGTTDLDYEGSLDEIAIDENEIDYLCSGASQYFRTPVTQDDIVWTFSGVRPLYDDGAPRAQEATRDYVLKTVGNVEDGVLINVFGGKITTYRRLSEIVLEKVEEVLGQRGRKWTANVPLPGGNFRYSEIEEEISRLRRAYPFLGAEHAQRLVRSYGTRSNSLLGNAATVADLGTHFGFDLYAIEVGYLMENEWAEQADDVLWRRTKCGLKLGKKEIVELERWMDSSRSDTGFRAAQQQV